MTQSRLSALEGSATLTLGRTLVRAARRPWSRGVQLPLDLIRMWRERGSLTGPGAADPGAGLGAAGRPGRRRGAVPVRADRARAGRAGHRAERARAGHHRRAQHAGVRHPGPRRRGVPAAAARRGRDAGKRRARTLVLIEAAAMLASSAWAYAGDPAADRPRPAARAADRGGPRAGQAGDLHPQRPAAPGARPGLGRGQLRRGIRRRLRRAAGPVQPGRAGRPAPVRPGLRRPRDPREAPAVRAMLDALPGRAARCR